MQELKRCFKRKRKVSPIIYTIFLFYSIKKAFTGAASGAE
jgi:hypothetical protein